MNLNRRNAFAALAGLSLAPTFPTLVQAQQQAPVAPPPPEGSDRIAMLLYPSMTALDLVGPYHFLASMPGAQVDLAVLFVPDGTMGTLAAARDPATIAFLRDRGSRARYITSVCTGSLVLGAAGLLRGRKATSHWITRDLLEQFEARR